ncbi:MAG: glutaminase A [Geminicoccaceae bacterium]
MSQALDRLDPAVRAVRDRYPVQRLLDELYDRYRDLDDGRLASYIPELAAVDPDRFAISLVTADGFAYDTGDREARFTIQSVSKAIVYGLALEDWGHDEVLRRIGVEPSGDPFNSISFDEANNRPYNPMVNAGAIAATSLIRGRDLAERQARLLATFERCVGRPLAIDEGVYRSELATGHRNRAIAYLELNAGMIEGDVEAHLDLYFWQCAILVTAHDLAVTAATLANGGLNPITGERALKAENVRDVLSVMTSCGMYDFAGEWQLSVGLAAKSGVGGGIIAVEPGELGIGVFSPLLDESGTSCRGVRVCRDLSQQLGLHMLNHRGHARTVVRRSYRLAEVRSHRRRGPQETALLDREGHRIVVYELQGDLSFPSLESLTRQVIQELGTAETVILDARRVLWLGALAAEILARLAERLRAQGRRLIICELPEAVLGGELEEVVGARIAGDLDATLEAAEDALLRRLAGPAACGEARPAAAELPLEEVDLLAGLADADLASLRAVLVPMRWAAGELLVREGEPADRLHLVVAGRAEMSIAASAGRRRLGSIEAGSVLDAQALFVTSRATADVQACGEVRCWVLTRHALDRLGETNPRLQTEILTRAGCAVAENLRRANAEVRALTA